MNPENLLPTEDVTEDAANYHALRVYLQVTQWKQLYLKCLNPLDMGWKHREGCLKSIKTELNAAPNFTLNVVRCICKITSMTCSYKNYGIKCVQDCGHCRCLPCTKARKNLIVNIHEDDYENIFGNLYDVSCIVIYD